MVADSDNGASPRIHRLIQCAPRWLVPSVAGVLMYGTERSASMYREAAALPVAARGGGKRGKVKALSTKAGRRLVRVLVDVAPAMLAAIPCAELGFLSLTFGSVFPCPADSKRALDAFLKRMRRAYPALCGVWVFEWQKRGAPHFHLLLFGPGVLETAFSDWCKVNWLGVSGPGGSTEADRLARGAVMVEPDSDAIEALGLIPYLVQELIKSKQKIAASMWPAPGRMWAVFNKAGVEALMLKHPPAQPVELAKDETDVVIARLQAVSESRMPEGWLRHRALNRPDTLQRFGDGGREYVRVGLDALGRAGAVVRSGNMEALDQVIKASRRFRVRRYGFNGMKYRKAWGRDTGTGERIMLRDIMDKDEYKHHAAKDRLTCSKWFPSVAELEDRYPALVPGLIVGA